MLASVYYNTGHRAGVSVAYNARVEERRIREDNSRVEEGLATEDSISTMPDDTHHR